MVKEEKIRDAISFQEESSDANNHFVKLIINGEKENLVVKAVDKTQEQQLDKEKMAVYLFL